MPANLPPQYYEAEKEYRAARTPQEKIEALENMLAIMPKHKGTDHLRAELRSKIAKLSEESEKRQGAGRVQLYSVRKEGAGQVALVGPPNSGKSQIMAALTEATPKVADYPFTTQLPQPAMMRFEDIQIQLVDLPPVAAEATPPWLRTIVRQADVLLLVVDLASDPLSDFESILNELQAMRVEPVSEGETGLTEEMILRKKAVVVANKLDVPDAPETLDLLRMEIGDRLPVIGVSAAQGTGLEKLKRSVFEALEIIRIYSKPPGKPADLARPFTMKKGDTIGDLAEEVHKEIAEKLKYAVVWGSGKFSAQRVGKGYVPEDRDVIELVS